MGFGVEKLACGGIVSCSMQRIALMRPVRPEAPSEWPTFAFAYNKVSFNDRNMMCVAYGTNINAMFFEMFGDGREFACKD